jgi:anti-anti-sigma factor
MDPLTFQSTTQPDGTVVLALIGSADITAAAALERQVTLLCAKRPKHVVFDLSQLTFISSLCMGTLVTLARSCKGWQGRATLAAPQPTVAGMFRHARIDVLIPIVTSVEAAVTPANA